MKIDGVELNDGDSVLFTNQKIRPSWWSWRRISRKFWKQNASANGVYVLNNGLWRRVGIKD